MRGRVSVLHFRLSTAVQELRERLIRGVAELAAVRPTPCLQALRGLWAHVDRHLAARAVLALHQADLVVGSSLVPSLASFCRILRNSTWCLRLRYRRLCGLEGRSRLALVRRRVRRSLQKSVDFRGRGGAGPADRAARVGGSSPHERSPWPPVRANLLPGRAAPSTRCGPRRAPWTRGSFGVLAN